MKNVKEILDNDKVNELRIKAVNYQDDLELGYEDTMIEELLNWAGQHIEGLEDLIYEIADSNIEIYTSELFRLYADNLKLKWYADQAIEELEFNDIINALQYGQVKYNTEFLFSVLSYLKDKNII